MADLSLTPFHDPTLFPGRSARPPRLAARCIITPRLELGFLGYYRNPTTELAAAFPCQAYRHLHHAPPSTANSRSLGTPARDHL